MLFIGALILSEQRYNASTFRTTWQIGTGNANSTSQATLVDYAESYHAVVCSSTNKHYGFIFFFFFFFFVSFWKENNETPYKIDLNKHNSRSNRPRTYMLFMFSGVYLTQATLGASMV